MSNTLTMKDVEAAAGWIEQFKAEKRRAPRILHVGNIANNAYQTAKMLNAAGADCDVLCADYYHTMGNPEWDDADFEGEVGNQSFPAFHKVDLHGFARPHWFSQGKRATAIEYLYLKRIGNEEKADVWWRKLQRQRRYLSFRESSFIKPLLLFFEGLFGKLQNGFAFALHKLGKADKTGWSPAENARVRARIEADAKALFPDRTMDFSNGVDYYIRTAFAYKKLFARYDIVQAYAMDPIWPYLAGHKSYVAYEHGTLRDAPYADSDLARLSLLAYAHANAVYVTNVDCYDSAVYITKNSGAPIVCGLHGFDTQRMLERQQSAASAGGFAREDYAADGQRLFFCPARVDIDPAYGTYLKQNDMLYRALARLHKEQPGSFKVLQLEWGQHTASLKQFIREECGGLEEAVVWHSPFQKREYYQILQHCQLVFDNFLLRLMGGNGIETLMSGHAALVNKRIPEEMMLRFFPEMWPIFAIEDEDDIYLAAKTALEDPAKCLATAQKGQQWILKYHSHAEIVKRNLAAYGLVLPLGAAAPPASG